MEKRLTIWPGVHMHLWFNQYHKDKSYIGSELRTGFGAAIWTPGWYSHIVRFAYPECPSGIHLRLFDRNNCIVVFDTTHLYGDHTT